MVDGIEAVTDVKFEDNEYLGGDWDTRGGHSNEGITGCLDNRYVCVIRKKYKQGTNPNDFVTGFGVNVDGRIGTISKYAKEKMAWKTHGDSKNWYSAGLIHDNVKCIYTKDELKP